jgi:hypothetical protein
LTELAAVSPNASPVPDATTLADEFVVLAPNGAPAVNVPLVALDTPPCAPLVLPLEELRKIHRFTIKPVRHGQGNGTKFLVLVNHLTIDDAVVAAVVKVGVSLVVLVEKDGMIVRTEFLDKQVFVRGEIDWQHRFHINATLYTFHWGRN